MIADLPVLLSSEECTQKPDGNEKTECITVNTTGGPVQYYKLIKENTGMRKRLRSSLSPRLTATTSPASKRLLSLQKDLRDEHDWHRKLQLLSQYRLNDEYDKIDGLIEKWSAIVRAAVEELWEEAKGRTGGNLTFQQFTAALQLGKRLERLVMCDDDDNNVDDDSGDSDDSVMKCLLEADQ